MKLHPSRFPISIPIVLTSLLLLATTPGKTASPPPNDNIANAQVIKSDSFSINGTEVGATQQAFEISPNFPDAFGFDLNASVWYSYTPETSGTLEVEGLSVDSSDGTAVFMFKGPGTPSQATFVGDTTPSGGNAFTADVTPSSSISFSSPTKKLRPTLSSSTGPLFLR